MLVNVLRFSFVDGTTERQRDEVLARMRRTASLESVSFGVVGRDLGDPAEGYTHAYLAGLADLAALERYLNDPVHIEGDDEILPHLAKLVGVRFSDDADPDLAAKMMALVQAKVAKYPAWGKRVDELAGG